MTPQIAESGQPIQGQAPSTVLSTVQDYPYPYYESIRSKGPVVWDEGMNAWLVISYDACLEVEFNEDRFASPYDGASDLVVQVKGGWANISISQGELHEKLRRLHFHLLSSKEVARYRDRVVMPIIHFLLDRILARGSGAAELTADFSDQLGPRMIAALFGMPWQDDELVRRILKLHEDIMAWIAQNVTGSTGGGDAYEKGEWGIAVSDEINAILLPYIRAARDNPGDDFASRLWAEGPSYLGDQLDETAVLGVCRELFLGGADTTVHALANCFYMLLTEPELRAAIENDRNDMLNNFVEEALRVYGSTQFRRRIARNDEHLAGADIKAGDAVVLLHAAAHRDPAQYACPAHIDLERPRPSEHLAFNKGPRSCVGAALARCELRESVAAVLDRLPGLRLDPDKAPPTYSGFLMRSWRPLHVRFDV